MTDPFPPRERSAYAHFHPIATRWSDNDAYGHVNNVLYHAFMDTAINRFLVDRGGFDFERDEAIGIVVENACRYFAPLAYPQTVTAGLRVPRLGSSSVRYELGLFEGDADEAAAVGYFVHVFVDRTGGRPRPIPDGIRAALAAISAATGD